MTTQQPQPPQLEAPERPDKRALITKLTEVLGFLHVINGEANLLVNFSDDPHLNPKERGQKIQEYRLNAHEQLCEVITGLDGRSESVGE